jgi:hypothetical protein
MFAPFICVDVLGPGSCRRAYPWFVPTEVLRLRQRFASETFGSAQDDNLEKMDDDSKTN